MTQKIQVILFSVENLRPMVLLFRRSDNRSWQPITGGVEEGESVSVAALREAREESGLSAPLRVIPNIHTLTFTNPPEHWRAGPVTEYVFGYELAPDFMPIISSEHSETKWFTIKEALDVLPTGDQKMALSKLEEILSK